MKQIHDVIQCKYVKKEIKRDILVCGLYTACICKYCCKYMCYIIQIPFCHPVKL